MSSTLQSSMQALHTRHSKKYLTSYHKLQVLPPLHLLPPSFSHQLLLLVTHLQPALEAGLEALPSAQRHRGRHPGRHRAQARHRLGELQLLFNIEQSSLTISPTIFAPLASLQHRVWVMTLLQALNSQLQLQH